MNTQEYLYLASRGGRREVGEKLNELRHDKELTQPEMAEAIGDDTHIDSWQSKLVVFVGVLMTMFGLIGLFLEMKLSRYH